MSEHFAWIYDKTRGVKTWVADMWSRRNILAMKQQITTLQSQLSTLQSNYTALEARVSALEGKNT